MARRKQVRGRIGSRERAGYERQDPDMDSRIVSGGADLLIIRDLFREYSEQVGVESLLSGIRE